MIVDHIDNWRLYETAHSLFPLAFKCLCETDWSLIDDGRFSISGEDIFAIVDRGRGKGTDNAKLEVHREYIDIQFLAEGADVMGYCPLIDCRDPETFEEDRDVGFFRDRPATWLHVGQSCFAIFYPADAHAPMGTEGDFLKVVVKVRA